MLLAVTRVKDVDQWLKVFGAMSAEERKPHGSKGSTAFRDPNESDRIWVVFDWDEEGWQSFTHNVDDAPILEARGDKTTPRHAEFLGHYDA